MKVRRDGSESWPHRSALEPRRDVPMISETILHSRRSFAVELLHRFMQRGPAGVQRSLVDRIAVRNIDMDAECEALVLRTGVAHFDDRFADADGGVHDLSVRCRESRELRRVECRFEEVEKIG